MSNNRPWDFDEALEALRKATRAQEATEQASREAQTQVSETERAYRKALALKIAELRAAGQPVTIASDLARGDNHVADLRYARDVALGVLDATKQASWRHAADRRGIEALIDWSKKREIAENGQPAWTPSIARGSP